MSTTNTAVTGQSKPLAEEKPLQEASAASAASAASGADRRRRKRVKIAAQVHLRAVNAPEPFEEICTTVDVSRDGLLVSASRAGYWKGLQLAVTFPYTTGSDSINQPQPAEVVRVGQQAGGKLSIALQFHSSRAAAHGDGKNSAKSFPGAAAAEALAGQQHVVLAVESDPRAAEMMRNLLQQDGYTVVIVPRAKDALEILRTTVPAVFIAEVESEEMSGHDLCLIIKRNERLQRVPVILLTRSAQPADYSASHQLGAVVCMAKPFKPERLQHVIHLVAPPPVSKISYGAGRVSRNVERAL